MSLLLTPYNPYWASEAVVNAVKIGEEVKARREALAASERETAAKIAANDRAQQQQQFTQSLKDQRVAFEIDRKNEFDRAKQAQEQANKDREFAEGKRQFDLQHSPFRRTASQSALADLASVLQSRDAAMPATTEPEPGNFGASALPEGLSFGAGAERPSQSVKGSVFGIVPDGAGGTMQDPNDVSDRNVPGFDPNRGAWGADIKNPTLKGVAVSPADLKAAGVPLNDPSGHEAEVTVNGQTRRYPIVDKLESPGRIDFTLPAYRELGGPESRGGGLIDGVKFRLLPKDSKADAASPPAESHAKSLLRALSQTGDAIDEFAEARGLTTPERNAMLRQATAATISNANITERRSSAASEINLFDTPKDALAAIAANSWEATPQFNPKSGKYFAKFNAISKTGPTSERFKEISEWPIVGGLRVDPEDGATRYIERPGARGSTFTLATDKFHHIGGKLVRIPVDGGEPEIVEGVSDAKAASPTIQKLYLGLRQKLTDAEASASSPYIANNPEFKQRAADEVARRREAVSFLEAMNPALRTTAADGPNANAIPATDKANAQPVFKTEAEARASGAKAGDVVTVINPATGKPARARLH